MLIEMYTNRVANVRMHKCSSQENMYYIILNYAKYNIFF
jgi:hypothetical protein